jgi:pantothenate synthetase
MSSRNIYLSPQQRQHAQALHQSMQTAKAQFATGETSPQVLIDTMSKTLTEANFKIDYIQIIDPKTLADVDQVQPGNRIAIAAYQGTTRLIDNTSLL